MEASERANESKKKAAVKCKGVKEANERREKSERVEEAGG